MKKVFILVEGQAEETFVKKLLFPYLFSQGLILEAKLVVTKRPPAGSHFKGGIQSFGQVERDTRRLLNDTSASLVTTMLDFYGLPKDFPGDRKMPGTCFERVRHLEEEFQKAIGHPKFLPYLSLHEFEAMLYVSPKQVALKLSEAALEDAISRIKAQYSSPEEINDGQSTAPSKRILHLHPKYRKTTDGIAILESIGIDQIRAECRHFSEWLETLITYF